MNAQNFQVALTYQAALEIANRTKYADRIDGWEYVEGVGHCFLLDDARTLVVEDDGKARVTR